MSNPNFAGAGAPRHVSGVHEDWPDAGQAVEGGEAVDPEGDNGAAAVHMSGRGLHAAIGRRGDMPLDSGYGGTFIETTGAKSGSADFSRSFGSPDSLAAAFEATRGIASGGVDVQIHMDYEA